MKATRLAHGIYRLEPPLVYDVLNGRRRRTKHLRYLCSVTDGCIVASSEKGHILHWTPLFGGSTLDPEQTLREAGYEIVEGGGGAAV